MSEEQAASGTTPGPVAEPGNQQSEPARAAAAQAAAEAEERTRPDTAGWSHEDAAVDEWEEESFPASDPPAP